MKRENNTYALKAGDGFETPITLKALEKPITYQSRTNHVSAGDVSRREQITF